MATGNQQQEWLEWEAELRRAMQALRAEGGHPRVLELLELQAATAMHNAYCAQDIPFPTIGVPGGASAA